MLIFIAALGIGFLLLMWSANSFADQALLLGQYFNIPKIIIGIVILGFGTSAPELLVSSISAWQGNPGLAIGNAVGSNITNILLVLGATLCVLPVIVSAQTLKHHFLLLLGATFLFSVLIIDHQLSFYDGVILFVALIFSLYLLSNFGGQETDIDCVTKTCQSIGRTSLGLMIALALLLLSSKLVVWGAVGVAQSLGISDIIIGLTIVALGTSLPELATCVASALKKHSELALGNVMGSNIFNTLGVTSVASLISTYSLPEIFYERDYPAMLIATVFLFTLALIFLAKGAIPRVFGLVFLTGYFIYMYMIFLQAM
ncbi:MAG: calcium/sodium antiporter [Pseudomonadota bacterium]